LSGLGTVHAVVEIDEAGRPIGICGWRGGSLATFWKPEDAEHAAGVLRTGGTRTVVQPFTLSN
jgi:hypothetical protein